MNTFKSQSIVWVMILLLQGRAELLAMPPSVKPLLEYEDFGDVEKQIPTSMAATERLVKGVPSRREDMKIIAGFCLDMARDVRPEYIPYPEALVGCLRLQNDFVRPMKTVDGAWLDVSADYVEAPVQFGGKSWVVVESAGATTYTSLRFEKAHGDEEVNPKSATKEFCEHVGRFFQWRVNENDFDTTSRDGRLYLKSRKESTIGRSMQGIVTPKYISISFPQYDHGDSRPAFITPPNQWLEKWTEFAGESMETVAPETEVPTHISGEDNRAYVSEILSRLSKDVNELSPEYRGMSVTPQEFSQAEGTMPSGVTEAFSWRLQGILRPEFVPSPTVVAANGRFARNYDIPGEGGCDILIVGIRVGDKGSYTSMRIGQTASTVQITGSRFANEKLDKNSAVQSVDKFLNKWFVNPTELREVEVKEVGGKYEVDAEVVGSSASRFTSIRAEVTGNVIAIKIARVSPTVNTNQANYRSVWFDVEIQ